MKKNLLSLVCFIFSFVTQAQQGSNHIGIGGTLGIPTGDFSDAVKVGYGGYVRGMVGVGNAGEATLTTGITSYRLKGLPPDVTAYYTIIPILIGYRHNLTGFYLEPQLGIGIYGAKATYSGQSNSDSKSAFTWAAGLGYQFSGIDIGLRYQSGKIKDAGSPFSIVGINVGYNIPLRGSSK
jgi:opacity protein-like surface antigen